MEELYDKLSKLYAYPVEGFPALFELAYREIQPVSPDAAAALDPLSERVRNEPLEVIQELYTRTFDINPVCTLEVGWHIYGEDYARGAFLVKMREKLRELGLTETQELPDHLTHVLPVLGRIEGAEADELAARYLLPALKKMTEPLLEKQNPYLGLLDATAQIVRQHHQVEVVEPRGRRGDPPGWSTPLPVFGQAITGSNNGGMSPSCGVSPAGVPGGFQKETKS